MSYKTKITLSLMGLAILVTVLSALVVWGTQDAYYKLERSRLAHDELETYLTISAETFRMFKQIRRDLMDGTGEASNQLEHAKGRFTELLRRLSAEIDREQALARESGALNEPLDGLQELTSEIEIALVEVEQVQALLRAGHRVQAVRLLSVTLEQRIDGRVSTLIDTGLVHQRQVAATLEQALLTFLERMRLSAQIVGIGVVVLASLVVWMLLRRLRGPLDALSHGTLEIASGRLSHRITLPGRDEFSNLAARFNQMAGDLEDQHNALRSAHESLERTVDERTEELRQANTALLEEDSRRRQFFADIGHELRTPITVILGEAEVALRTKAEPEQAYRDALQRIVTHSGQMGRLVGDLFLIARSEAGMLDMRDQRVDLAEIVRDAADATRAMNSPRLSAVHEKLSEHAMIIDGDAQRLRQLLLILSENALRYAGDQVEITFDLTCNAHSAILNVADNGPGIAEADMAHIFDRFFKSRGRRRSTVSSSGLGLAIAKSIAVAHGGRIEAHNPAAGGVVFKITLPLPDSSVIRAASQAPQSQSKTGAGGPPST